MGTRATLVHIPRGAIRAVTEEYTRVLGNLNDCPGWETLQAVWAFPKAVLAPLTRGGKSKWSMTSRRIVERAQLFRTMGASAAWDETERAVNKERLGTRLTESKMKRAVDQAFVERVLRAVGNDAVSKACQMLVSDGVLDSRKPEVVQKLCQTH